MLVSKKSGINVSAHAYKIKNCKQQAELTYFQQTSLQYIAFTTFVLGIVSLTCIFGYLISSFTNQDRVDENKEWDGSLLEASKGLAAVIFWIAMRAFLGEGDKYVVRKQPSLKTLQFKDRSKFFKIFYVFVFSTTLVAILLAVFFLKNLATNRQGTKNIKEVEE